MSRLLIIAALALQIGCTAAQKYPGWDLVYIAFEVPVTQSCNYLGQLSCPPTALEGCHNWHRKRGTVKGANVVVMTGPTLGEHMYCMPKPTKVETPDRFTL